MDNTASKQLLQSLRETQEEWRYETTQQKANRRRFEAIHHGLFNSRPGKASQVQGDLSTRFPEHYLITSLKKPPPVDPESLLPALPPALHTIRKLQKKNGSWEPSPELYRALGGNIPDPPEGVSRWRWATALVVVFIGRHPHLHTALNPLYEAAREWSADPHLMRSASEALPPSFSDQPCYFPLNETALKTRRWQDGAMESLQRVGYRLFVPKEHRFSSLYPGTEDEIQWFERMAELERTAPFKVAGSMDTGGAGGSESDAEQEGKDVLAPLRSDAVPGTATSSNTRRLSRSSGTSVASAASSAPPSDTQSVRTQQPVVDPRIAAAMAVLREHKAKKANSKTIRSRAPRRVRKVRGKHKKALRFEWREIGKQEEEQLQPGERVCCNWRRGERWEQPTKQATVAPAVVSRVNANGTADVAYQVPPFERENSVSRDCIFRVGEKGYVDYFGILSSHAPVSLETLPTVRASGMLQSEADAIVGAMRARRTWKPTRSAKLRQRWLDEPVPKVAEETTQLEGWRTRVYARRPFSVRHDRAKADKAFRSRPPSVLFPKPSPAEIRRRWETLPGYTPPPEPVSSVTRTLRTLAKSHTAPVGSMSRQPLAPMDGPPRAQTAATSLGGEQVHAHTTPLPGSSQASAAPHDTASARGNGGDGGIPTVAKVGKVRPSSKHLPRLPRSPEPPPAQLALQNRYIAIPPPGMSRRPASRSLEADPGVDMSLSMASVFSVPNAIASTSRAQVPPPGASPRTRPPHSASAVVAAALAAASDNEGDEEQVGNTAPSPSQDAGTGVGRVSEQPAGLERDTAVSGARTPHAAPPPTPQPRAAQPQSTSDADMGGEVGTSAAGAGAPGDARGSGSEADDERDTAKGHARQSDGSASSAGGGSDADSSTKARRRARRARQQRTHRMRLRQRRRRRRSRVARYAATGRKLGLDSSSGGYTSTSSSEERGWTTDEEEEQQRKPNYSTMTHEELIQLINERQAVSRHRPPSESSDGVSSDEEALDLIHDHPANKRQRLEDRIVRALTVHERLVHQVMLDTLAGSVKWRTAVTYKQKQAAFRKTTIGLQRIRRAACRLVECVTEWQEVEAKDFGTARKMLTERIKHGEASNPTPPIMGKPWPRQPHLPPPFYWHGEDVLIKLATSLDFLDGVPELQEWYQGLLFTRNPFVLALPLDRRPPTPRKTTRRVRVGKDWVDKEFKSLVAGRKMDVAAQKDYIRECRKITAEWWPCHGINKHTYERVREAERSVLVAEFCAREAASAILHGSTAIRAKQTPHAMDGVSRAGVPVEDAQDGAKKGAAS